MKNDHRVRLTKRLLTEGLVRLAEETPVSRITVKALCEDCGINRATFYAHYPDLGSLQSEIIESLQQEVQQLINRMFAEKDPQPALEAVFRCCRARPEACQLIFGKNSTAVRFDYTEAAQKKQLALVRKAGSADPVSASLHLSFFLNGMQALLCEWVRNNMPTPSQATMTLLCDEVRQCKQALHYEFMQSYTNAGDKN